MTRHYKQKRLIVPIYKSLVYFIDTNNCDKLNSTHPTTEENEPYAFASNLKKYRNGTITNYYVIVLNTKGSYKKPSIGVLAHECLHLVDMIFRNYGVKPDFKNDEPNAYLLEYFVNEAMKFYYPDKVI